MFRSLREKPTANLLVRCFCCAALKNPEGRLSAALHVASLLPLAAMSARSKLTSALREGIAFRNPSSAKEPETTVGSPEESAVVTAKPSEGDNDVTNLPLPSESPSLQK